MISFNENLYATIEQNKEITKFNYLYQTAYLLWTRSFNKDSTEIVVCLTILRIFVFWATAQGCSPTNLYLVSVSDKTRSPEIFYHDLSLICIVKFKFNIITVKVLILVNDDCFQFELFFAVWFVMQAVCGRVAYATTDIFPQSTGQSTGVRFLDNVRFHLKKQNKTKTKQQNKVVLNKL